MTDQKNIQQQSFHKELKIPQGMNIVLNKQYNPQNVYFEKGNEKFKYKDLFVESEPGFKINSTSVHNSKQGRKDYRKDKLPQKIEQTTNPDIFPQILRNRNSSWQNGNILYFSKQVQPDWQHNSFRSQNKPSNKPQMWYSQQHNPRTSIDLNNRIPVPNQIISSAQFHFEDNPNPNSSFIYGLSNPDLQKKIYSVQSQNVIDKQHQCFDLNNQNSKRLKKQQKNMVQKITSNIKQEEHQSEITQNIAFMSINQSNTNEKSLQININESRILPLAKDTSSILEHSLMSSIKDNSCSLQQLKQIQEKNYYLQLQSKLQFLKELKENQWNKVFVIVQCQNVQKLVLAGIKLKEIEYQMNLKTQADNGGTTEFVQLKKEIEKQYFRIKNKELKIKNIERQQWHMADIKKTTFSNPIDIDQIELICLCGNNSAVVIDAFKQGNYTCRSCDKQVKCKIYTRIH